MLDPLLSARLLAVAEELLDDAVDWDELLVEDAEIEEVEEAAEEVERGRAEEPISSGRMGELGPTAFWLVRNSVSGTIERSADLLPIRLEHV